jgi:hypothetical protein
MTKKEKLVKRINHYISKVNDKGLKEYAAWFKYYHSMDYVLINLLDENKIKHCLFIAKDIASNKEFRGGIVYEKEIKE